MDRRTLLLSGAAAAAWAPGVAMAAGRRRFRRVRPTDRAWPSASAWRALGAALGGRLHRINSPWPAARSAPQSPETAALFAKLRNPYAIGDDPALTQTLGWVDAWTSEPSAWVVAAQGAQDVATAVNFARSHRLRLVVKGGGHSYLGGSNAANSLMVWTRPMREILMHEAFVPQGAEGKVPPQPAVSVGAGAIWAQVYDAVTTRGGRYVQGGGCTTVGVAGLVQGGGFGSFSKAYGTGAGGVIEAEIVTADGQVRIANAAVNPELYWALKGGGGGTFGVVTRLTLMTHALPKFFGGANVEITARSDAAYRRLIAATMTHYREVLFNPHWGEQITFRADRRMSVNMVFQGLTQAEATAAWKPFLDRLRAAPEDYAVGAPIIIALPAQRMWDPTLLKSAPGLIRMDDRSGAAPGAFYWSGDAGQVGQVLHGYQSVWLSQRWLAADQQTALVEALYAAAMGWGVSLHFNKGLAGANEAGRALAQDTAMNPAVLDAFALAIIGGAGPPAYPGVLGHEPDVAKGRSDARAIAAAFAPLRTLAGAPAAYLSEADYFQPDWQAAFWGSANYARLAAVKATYDPDGLFYVHHSVGSETWSADGFERRA